MSVRILLTADQWASIVGDLHRIEKAATELGDGRAMWLDSGADVARWCATVRKTLEQEAITPTDEKAGR